MGSLLLPCAATGVSLLAGWGVIGATHRGQPWTPAVRLPHRRDGLSARLLEVWCTFCRPSLCRQVHRAFMRNALLDYTPILPATACHQSSYVETYSRYRNQTAFLVVWGTDDDLVDPHSQSEAFVTALKQAGFFVRTVIVPGAPHFWMWDPLDEPTSFTGFVAPRLLRFLQQQL